MNKMERDPMEMALSTDIVMDIVLSYLKTTDLLSCREVSKFLNRTASSALRKRSTMMKLIYDKDLMKLVECMKLSSDFPFAGLQLHYLWKFKSNCTKEFFQNYGDRFTRLRFKAHWATLKALASFIIYLPRLSILEVSGRKRGPCHVESLDLDARKRYGGVELTSVRIIRFFSSDEVDKGILHEVVTAASPSVQIECLDAEPETLRALRSGGKLQAISFLEIHSDLSYCWYRPKFEMDELLSVDSPSLSKLQFTASRCLPVDGLEKLLVSSQHTLKDLHLDGQWLSQYSWENFPVLDKLTKLSLRLEFCRGSLFRGSHGNIFPALKELHLHFEDYYIGNRNVGPGNSSGLFVVPSVTRIHLEGHVDEDGMEQLAQSFPSVTDIRLNYSDYELQRRHPFQIWSVEEFKYLEKLKIWNVTVRQPTKTYPSMDSFLTGIPVDICKYLNEKKQVDLVDSLHDEVVVERNNPSILHLGNLKELVVCVQPGYRIRKDNGVTPFISMVSVRYALDMMPNLQTKFVYQCPSPLSRSAEDELVKTMLEAAFKHVQPSIKLEPFFY